MKQNTDGISKRSRNTRTYYYSILLSFFLVAVFLIFSFSDGYCAQVTLTWDPNSETDLAGYDIYYGTSSGNYQSKIDVGNVTTYTVNGLTVGVTYYLAATAYNTQGLQSGYSNEVVYSVPSCTFSISPSSASFSTSGGSGSVLVTTQAGCNWGTSTAPSWITVDSGSGTGTGTMSYTVSPNSGANRVASLTVAGNVFTVNETGIQTYTITASAGTGGAISPSGGVNVQSGANQTFNITANTGYKIAGVTVDGVSQGAIASYTFSAVSANHTISATFTPLTYFTLSTSNGGTGSGSISVNPVGTSYLAGTPVTLTANPNANSVFSGWSGGCSGSSASCQVTMNSNVSVTATFNLKTYTITASAGTGSGHGTINPAAQTVLSGSTAVVTVSPDSGYTATASGCGGSLTNNIFTTGAVNAACTITVNFISTSTCGGACR